MQFKTTLNPVPYSAPAVEPVDVDTLLKPHSRVDSTDEAALLAVYAKSCRRSLEKMLGLSLINTTWDEYADFFPCDNGEIRLSRAPVSSVTSLTYYDAAGVQQTLVENTDFRVDSVRRPARIMPVFGTVWPVAGIRPNAVKIRYVAGFGSAASSVPEDLQHALALLFTSTYETRNPAIDYEKYDVPIPLGLQQILTNNTVWSF